MHVVLVHGAGLGTRSYAGVLDRMRCLGIHAVAPARRGYDGGAPSRLLDHHVDDLADCVARVTKAHGGPPVVAGVSGGATLTLALAARGEPAVKAAVVHEPLIGERASLQHQIIGRSIADLRANDDIAGFDEFMARLVTDRVWSSLDEELVAESRSRAAVVREESAGFAGFALEDVELATAAQVTTWTVGAGSPNWRHEAAAVGERHGIRVVAVPGHHTPQIEAPDEWLDVLVEAGTDP